MKKASIVLLGVFVLSLACGQKAPEPRYAPDSKEYEFFQKLTEKVPILNPDESNELVSTKKFSVYTSDIMPDIFQMWSRYAQNLDKIPAGQLESFIQQAASQEAEKRLLITAATKNNISVTEDTVQAELQKYYASSGGEDKFVKRITDQGLTIDFVMNDIKDKLTVQKYLDDTIFGQASEISEEEIRSVYEQDTKATVRHILMKTENKSESEKLDIRKKMEDILAQARAGEDFAELAKQYTEDTGSKDKGGLYEDFPRGRMVKSFEDASFELPIGSISDLVETQYGYHIIKVISRSKETRPFDEVKEQLRKNLISTKKRDSYGSLIESLKEEYKYKELFTA